MYSQAWRPLLFHGIDQARILLRRYEPKIISATRIDPILVDPNHLGNFIRVEPGRIHHCLSGNFAALRYDAKSTLRIATDISNFTVHDKLSAFFFGSEL